MNILFINTKGKFGGVVGWMCRAVEALEKRGHHCWIISTKKSELNQYAPKNIKIVEINSVSDYSPIIISFIYQFIKKNKIDVVFTNTTKEITVGGVAAKLAGIPNIRRVGNYTDLNNSKKNRFLSKHFVTHTIAPCQAILDKAQNTYHWLKPEMYSVIYNGRNPVPVDPDSVLQLKEDNRIPPGAFVFGMNVQLVRAKGIGDVIRAFGLVIIKHPECYLIICGDGNLKEEINHNRRQMRMEDRIITPGFQKNVLEWSSMYNVGMLASYDEGFPNTIVEYMAAGIPVISSNVGGVAEIVKHEHNGFLFRAGDIQSLVRDMNQVIEDHKLRLEMGVNALQTIQDKFTEDIMIDKLEGLINEYIPHQHRLSKSQ